VNDGGGGGDAKDRLVPGPERALIGRDAACDSVLDSASVARFHAAIAADGEGVALEGLAGGVFVNGASVGRRQRLVPGDRVRVGPFVFTFDGRAFSREDERGRVTLEGRALSKRIPGGLEILRDVSLVAKPGEFVGVVGASGAGKSTLLSLLAGFRAPTSGRVLLNGEDLAPRFESLKTHVGFVPQDEIVHRELRVKDVLSYSARLRLPRDLGRKEIAARVESILATLGLEERADARVHRLSGGERRRVNLGVELLTEPSLLFLDEPTSGLDPGNEDRLMKLFRKLATDGRRTVILTTHVMENADLFDLVAVLVKGRLAWYGPPREALAHFGIAKLTRLFEALDARSPEEHAARCRASGAYRAAVEERLSAAAVESAPRARRRRPRAAIVSQFATLSRRYVATIAGDPRNLLALLVPGPLIGFLLTLPLDARLADDRWKLLFLLAITAIFCGTFNAFREILKERSIFERERMAGLRAIPYVASKLFVQSAFLAVECALLLGTVLAFEALPGDRALLAGGLFGAAVASAAMALLVSAAVRSAEKATGILIVLLLPQIIFAGAIAPLAGVSKKIGKAMIANWTFDGLLEVSLGLGRGLSEFAVVAGFAAGAFALATLALSVRRRIDR
jgi:ABC-type multidrug transport system ATPase subunit